MLLSVPSLLLLLHSISGVIAAPAKDNIDLTYDRDGEYDAHPAKSTKAKISVDNDYKVPGEKQPNYHILVADTSVTQLGVDPVVAHADKDDTDDDDDDNASNEKRSIFHQLFARALTDDQTAALKLHNDARKKVKVSALKWDTDLEADALAYAKKIAKAGKMTHSAGKDRPGQGENLAYAWASNGFKNPITAGAKGWYVSFPIIHQRLLTNVTGSTRRRTTTERSFPRATSLHTATTVCSPLHLTSYSELTQYQLKLSGTSLPRSVSLPPRTRRALGTRSLDTLLPATLSVRSLTKRNTMTKMDLM